MLLLNKKLEVIIPKEDNNGKVINSKAIQTEIEQITNTCGGYTATEVQGAWYSTEEQRLMIDNNINYEWYHDGEHTLELSQRVQNIIFALCGDHGQEAVSIKINGQLLIVFNTDDCQETQETIQNLLDN